MKKLKTYQQLIEHKLIVVIRGNSYEEAMETTAACLDTGVKNIEITYTTPDAGLVISHFAKRPDICIGAGSVLDSETAKMAISAGATFIVGPNFSQTIASLCNRYQVPYIPGCMTVNEAVQALEAGASIIKLFPGQVFEPSHIKAMKGPLPQLEIMPTGGVDLNNIQSWLNQGALLVGVGSDITKAGAKKDYDTVRSKAAAYLEAVKGVVV